MSGARALATSLLQEQHALFRSSNASRNSVRATEEQRKESLKLLESAGWQKTGEIVCMVEECFASLEIWKRKRKGKRAETKYLDRDALTLHEVSTEGRHGKQNFA